MRLVILALLILAGCAQAPVAEPAPEPIVLSYSYGSQMVASYPFGEDGPAVIGCEERYELN